MLMRFITAAAALAISAPILAQTDAKADFQARYTQLSEAMQARDEAAVGAILAPDYTMTDANGDTRTRDQMMGARRGGPARPAGAAPASPSDPAKAAARPQRQVTTTVQSATVSGPIANIVLQTQASGSRTGDDGKPHTMEMSSVSNDTWVKVGDAWKLKATVQKSIEVKRDGEVVFKQG